MHKATAVQAKDDYKIRVEFDDGKVVLFDVKPLFSLIPAFRELQTEPELFGAVNIEQDGEVISWNSNLNLDAKTVWAKGTLLEFTKKPDVNHLLAYRLQLSRFFAGMTQKELAEKTGIYQADISKLERGLGNPSINTLERIAEGLDMELFIDFRYPADKKEDKTEKGEKQMGRLAARKNYGVMIKPGMTNAFIQHMMENKKPDDYWEECAKSRDISDEAMEHMMKLIRGEDE